MRRWDREVGRQEAHEMNKDGGDMKKWHWMKGRICTKKKDTQKEHEAQSVLDYTKSILSLHLNPSQIIEGFKAENQNILFIL